MKPRRRTRRRTSRSAAGLCTALAIITATPPSEAKVSAVASTSASSTAPRPARARGDVPLAATLGLSIGSTRETLRLSREDGASSVDTRALMTSRLDLGLNYIVAGIGGERWRLRGQSSLVGLGAEEETIAGAAQRRSASTGVAPFEVMLRVRVPIPRRR